MSSRGSDGALSGPASPWERRAAQSRQARPEEAQEPSWGPAKGALLPCGAAAAGEEEGGLRDEDEADGIEHDDAVEGPVDPLTWLGVGVGVGVGVGSGLAIEGPVDPLTEEEVGERRGEHGRDVDDRGRVAWLGLGLGVGLGSESV